MNQINPHTGDSWTAPINVVRVAPDQKPNDVAVDQIIETVERINAEQVPLFVLDAGYSPVRISAAGLGDTRAQLLVRVREGALSRSTAANGQARTPGQARKPLFVFRRENMGTANGQLGHRHRAA